MMPDIVIRPAVSDDASCIVAIARDSFIDPWTEGSLREAVDQSVAGERTVVVVATVNGAVCGYAVAWTVGDEGEIADLAVAPEHRGCGIGARLLEAVLGLCARRSAARIFLEVRAGNDGARRLYERCGFVQIGVRRNYYRDGEDALVMKKVLT